jgi:hypothetical protein
MPNRHNSPLQMYNAQLRRFQAVGDNALQGMQILKRDMLDEIDELVRGQGVSGPNRIKALRAAGHPYARKASPMDSGGKRFGGKRGKDARGGSFNQLPIGLISGRLRSAKFARLDRFELTVGFDKRAGRSIYVVLPFGTNNMVGRGLWLPGEKGELGKRAKRARRAFNAAFFDPLKKP